MGQIEKLLNAGKHKEFFAAIEKLTESYSITSSYTKIEKYLGSSLCVDDVDGFIRRAEELALRITSGRDTVFCLKKIMYGSLFCGRRDLFSVFFEKIICLIPTLAPDHAEFCLRNLYYLIKERNQINDPVLFKRIVAALAESTADLDEPWRIEAQVKLFCLLQELEDQESLLIVQRVLRKRLKKTDKT